jgi:putative membrane protein
MGGGMMTGFGSYGLLGGLFGLLFNIALIVGVIVLVVWAVQKFSNAASSHQQSNQGPSAREILDRRYALGELNRDEYQQKLADISA